MIVVIIIVDVNNENIVIKVVVLIRMEEMMIKECENSNMCNNIYGDIGGMNNDRVMVIYKLYG